MTEIKRILIVDDDPRIRETLKFAFEKNGFATVEAADGRQALERFEQTSPSLIVLDIMMPELDGTEVCRIIRAKSSVPILFLSSKDDEIDRIVNLEMGGDDYVSKPFSPRELVARVRAILRRAESGGSVKSSDREERRESVKTYGKLSVNLDTYETKFEGKSVSLTVTEFHLLAAMIRWPGKVFTRDELMRCAHEYEVVVTDRTIDSHIKRIRAKFGALCETVIETVHGAGYRLGSCK